MCTMCMQVPLGSQRVSDSLKLELVGSCLIWVLGTKPESSLTIHSHPFL